MFQGSLPSGRPLPKDPKYKTRGASRDFVSGIINTVVSGIYFRFGHVDA